VTGLIWRIHDSRIKYIIKLNSLDFFKNNFRQDEKH